MFWGCGDDIQVFALFATKFEADLCVFPAKFAKTRKLNQTFAYNDNAAAITNPSTGSKFTPHASSSSKRFTIIPSTASANIYWPLESPAPITFPSFNTTTPNESIFTAGQISCNGQ